MGGGGGGGGGGSDIQGGGGGGGGAELFSDKANEPPEISIIRFSY